MNGTQHYNHSGWCWLPGTASELHHTISCRCLLLRCLAEEHISLTVLYNCMFHSISMLITLHPIFWWCLYTYIYSLFGNAVGSRDYKGLNGSMITWLNYWKYVEWSGYCPIWSTFKNWGKLRNFKMVSVPLKFKMITSWLLVRNSTAWATLHSRAHTSHNINMFLCFQTRVIMSPLFLVLEVSQKHVSFVTHLLSPCFFQTSLPSTLKMEAVS